jgi:hypothetical protein
MLQRHIPPHGEWPQWAVARRCSGSETTGGEQPFAALRRPLLIFAAAISLHDEPRGSEKAVAG